MSPSRLLTSLDTRFDVVTYLNDGMAIIAMMATIAMTMRSSRRLKPDMFFMVAIILGGEVKASNLLETDDQGSRCSECDGGRKADDLNRGSRAPGLLSRAEQGLARFG